MVTRDEMLRAARRYDTLMSRAMLRALGCQGGGRRRPRKTAGGRAGERAKYRGMRRCFANRESPMDRL